jgi:thioredoxin-like negative regulator of GroEL
MFHADALVRKKEEVAAGRALRIYEQLSFTDAEQTGSGNSDAVDVGLTIGRARCLRTLDRLEEAIRILTPLCSGLSSDSAEFWTAQIERAECIAMSDDSEDLELLLVLIRQLRALDPDMGRPYVQKRFERLEARIRATLEGA